MINATHPFSQTDVMAYLDGELSADRALAFARHLDHCRECESLAADFKNLSEQLAGWTFESRVPLPLPEPATVPAQTGRRAGWMRGFWTKHPGPLVVAGLASIGILLWMPFKGRHVGPEPQERPQLQQRLQEYSQLESAKTPPPAQAFASKPQMLESSAPPSADTGPLIVRTAQVSIVTDAFDRSRAAIESLAKAQGGYVSQLELATPPQMSRSLSATLRLPSVRMDEAIQQIKKMGRTVEEWQRGEDVTRRYVDINARLSNLRATESRLLQILRDRTGKLADVLQVEQAVDRTRGDIETTEAEQKSLAGQIAMATVNVRISEEYKAAVGNHDGAISTRLNNAAVAGYQKIVDGLLAALEFLLSNGPALLFLSAIAFLPARWLWRRTRQSSGAGAAAN